MYKFLNLRKKTMIYKSNFKKKHNLYKNNKNSNSNKII